MGGNTALLDDIKTAKKNITITSDTITSAHATFTNQVTSFLSLTEQLDDKIKELEEREIKVEKREHEARAKVQQLEERERKCVEKEKEVEERDKSVQAKEARWNETEKRMEENAAKLPNVIPLNVSGKCFSIEKEKLLQHKGSLLEQMVITNHPALLSNASDSQEKKLFINRDPGLFKYIARFLLVGELHLPSKAKELDLIAREFDYFKLSFNVPKPGIQATFNLNVSGTKFTIAKDNMLQHKGSLFESIVANPQQFSAGGEIFLARDPKLFKRIMQFIVHGKLIPPLKVDMKLLQQEFEHFRIPFKCPIQSVLLERTVFGDKIAEWLPNKEFQLLYKASEHGFGAAEFHRHCDNKGSTLTLIRSKDGYLFGGYSVLPWDSTTNNYKQHPEGFIFTLSNPHNIPPTKYPRNGQNAYAIYCHGSYGPSFGNNHDIYVASNSNQNSSSYTNIGAGYVDLTGKGAQTTFTGAYQFTTSDVEVFAVL